MFYRPWKALPRDPNFPSDLQELGYHVHESNEIRSTENPNNYFKFFISRNKRYNERQRFAMNEATEKVVHTRLEALGLKKILLPLGTTSSTTPNVPIFVSSNIKSKSRVIIVIGETYQDLGILAHRVLSGPGGIEKGSMISVVASLQAQPSSPTDSSPPGFILANTGQFIWHSELQRSLTIVGAEGAPMPSAVHAGLKWHGEVGKDRVPGSEDTRAHIRTIFEIVVPAFVDQHAAIDVIAVGDGADALEKVFDWSETWKKLAGRINCMAIMGGYHAIDELQCAGLREFLREKARAYATSTEPLGTALSGPDGNPHTKTFTRIGAPMFSGGEPYFVETLLIHALPHLANWMLEVTLAGQGNYRNPDVTVIYKDPADETKQFEPDWSKWQNAPLYEQPSTDFGFAASEADTSSENDGVEIKEQRKQAATEDKDKEIGKYKVEKEVIVSSNTEEEDDRDQDVKNLVNKLQKESI